MASNASQFLSEPCVPPKLDLPSSSTTVEVRLIDTKFEVDFIGPPPKFYEPETPGFKDFTLPIYAFLISHGDRHLLFDAGMRRDPQNCAPVVAKMASQSMRFHEVDHDVASILDNDTRLGVRSTDIEALIWSHTHFDHIGDPSRFPSTTNLIVGPGVKATIEVGYPTKEDAMTLDSDVAGREVLEVNFGSGLVVAGFPAYDYFGDGSFYLLDAPGHAQGHMCALARTTHDTISGKSTFVYLGADACHHPGLLRPTEFLPLPRSINPSPFASQRATATGCPGHTLQALLTHGEPNKPVFQLSNNPMCLDHQTALATVRKMQEVDALGNVFILLAHDASILSEVPVFPETVNPWYSEGWHNLTRWRFFSDCEDVVLGKKE
ncbi:Cytochrome P450 monooxygenase mpaDE [Paramyrothecium foliicola]|nr:Cytochrome P450 monooxygenase mpaDE [Paramyrothecium foliicola]